MFRRSVTWARALVAAAGVALATAAAGLIAVGLGETDMALIFERTRPYAIASVATVTACFLWNGIESWRYAAMLKRRLALGLSDPVLYDRFRLWAIVGFASTAMCGVLGACMLAGLPPLTEPAPMLVTAVMGTVAGVAWYLSFLPPQRYLAHVRRRTEAQR